MYFTSPKDDKSWYIIPMCPGHNHPSVTGELTVIPSALTDRAPLRAADDFTCKPKPKKKKKSGKKSSKK